MLIESNQNPKFKKWSKLKQKKNRNQMQEYLIEGEHLVLEAIKTQSIKEILVREGSEHLQKKEILEGNQYYVINSKLFNTLAGTETPQPIMAVCEMKKTPIINEKRLLLLDKVQDPGNLGTLIRSAVAFGFDGIVLGDGCVDLYNEKVVRSTQGAIFKIAIEQKSLLECIKELHQNNVLVFGTSLENGEPLQTIQRSEKMAFILGNEGQGVSKELIAEMKQNIFIEIDENIESLNVSIAGSIIMYQFRQ